MINVYCEDRGWLFEDLKREIARAGAVASELPRRQAKAWICIRTKEAYSVPDRSRTVVQVHDMNCPDLQGFGMVSLVHFDQRFKGDGPYSVKPIGSRDVECGPLPEKPAIGFFAREVDGNTKRSQWFLDAVKIAREFVDFDVVIIGQRLDHLREIGEVEDRGAIPADYQRIDALVVCSDTPMVPLSAYEARAAGRLVISTPRNWPRAGFDGIVYANNQQEIAERIIDAVLNRRQHSIQAPFRRSDWARTQVQLAQALIK